MTLLVVGGGGREHAIIHRLAQSPRAGTIFALPGNGGIAELATCVPIAATDIEGIVAFAQSHAVDFAVVAPDDPLVLGAVDALEAAGVRCFGPTKAAARLEGSKIFAKELMRANGIPTARYDVFESEREAIAHMLGLEFPIVIKADGLALGKGVVVAENRAEAQRALRAMMTERVFGESGRRVIIEECLRGPEVSVLAFTDGKTIVPMVSSMDHKRALDGDLGANTGGMGAIAQNPFYTPEIAERCMREIFLPTLGALSRLGCPFKGCLYFGLMLTQEGPKVIEYNCRFGDPETQAVLPLLDGDLLEIFEAVADERLHELDIRLSSRASCCVMVVSGGYPGAYAKGFPISIGKTDATLYHSGTALDADGRLVTSGGRVMGATAVGETLPEAIDRAYAGAKAVRFDGAFYRRDIGMRALDALGEG